LVCCLAELQPDPAHIEYIVQGMSFWEITSN